MSYKLVVLLPHFNSINNLLKTVSSISEDFEIDLLIVDDGSESKPQKTSIEEAYQNKGNVILELMPVNQGIEKALNYGLNYIKNKDYKYIARLDAGDIVYPNKFKKQLQYLENNSDVYLLGTWGNIVDESLNHLYYLKNPVNYQEIQKKMYLNSCFIHPTVIFRKEVLFTVGLYPENRKSAEDFAYFFKIMKKHKVENFPEVLLNVIIDPNGISVTKRKEQIKNRIQIIKDNFYFGLYPILGLIRNSLLLHTSRGFVVKISKYLRK